MPLSAAYKAFLLDQFALFGPIVIRPMFGGAGIFRDSLMFALVVDETLYLKADDTNRPDFDRRGMKPFTYLRKSKPASLAYYEVPADVLEDPQEMREWAERAFAVALSADRRKASRKKRTR